MNFVTGLLLGLAICNGVMARHVNGGFGGNGTVKSKAGYTINILTINWDAGKELLVGILIWSKQDAKI